MKLLEDTVLKIQELLKEAVDLALPCAAKARHRHQLQQFRC
jgi:hypothetical protein